MIGISSRRFLGRARALVARSYVEGAFPAGAEPPMGPLCKHCKHFLQPVDTKARYGRCARFGRINMVDGSQEFWYASMVRDSHCKGDWFEQRRSLLPRFYKVEYSTAVPIAMLVMLVYAILRIFFLLA